MSVSGTYEEELEGGGKLVVSASGWGIRYYFAGPDFRYKGEFVTVEGARIREYMEAFSENWVEYLRLKGTLPAGGEFQKLGKCGMTIRVGKFAQGVCLKSYHMCISSELDLRKVISAYEHASVRAQQVQGMLRSL